MPEFLMPQLSESVTEGEIVKWMVQVGDVVTENQPLVEVMTDKVTVELPSPFAGKIQQLLVKEGDVVPMKAPLAIIGDGAAPAAKPAAETKPETKTEKKDESATESAVSGSYGAGSSKAKIDFGSAAKTTQAPTGNAQNLANTNKFGRVLAVPAARKLARENGIDIAAVPGSGPIGRVAVSDVQAFANGAQVAIATKSTAAPTVYTSPVNYAERETRTPMRGLRRAIANAMMNSHLGTVRTLTVDEIDFTRLVELRARLKTQVEARGIKLTYLPFIFKAATRALQDFPNVNSSIDDAKSEIVRKNYYNIGCAVDTPAGLVVPVVKDTNQKSVLQIAQDILELAGKARDGKLSTEDMTGSTFSVTNIGSAGSLLSFPIINTPDAAILGVHTITERPVVRDGQIVVRHMMYLSLSFDHRLIDGAEGARFVKRMKELLENPDLMFLDMA